MAVGKGRPGKVKSKKTRATVPLVPKDSLKTKLSEYVRDLDLLQAPFNIIIYKDKELQHAPVAAGLLEQKKLLQVLLPLTDSGLMRSAT